jgi:selenide,water dikinase
VFDKCSVHVIDCARHAHSRLPDFMTTLRRPQVAVNVWQWRNRPERWAKIEHVIDRDGAARAYDAASESMGRLNLNGGWRRRGEGGDSKSWKGGSSLELVPGAAATFAASSTRTAAARLVHKHGAHAATDVTGFGFLGHARWE